MGICPQGLRKCDYDSKKKGLHVQTKAVSFKAERCDPDGPTHRRIPRPDRSERPNDRAVCTTPESARANIRQKEDVYSEKRDKTERLLFN